LTLIGCTAIVGNKLSAIERVNMTSAVAPMKWLMERWLHSRTFAIWAASVLAVSVRIGVSFVFKTYQFDPARNHWDFGFEWGRIASWLVRNGMFSLDGKVSTADTDPLYSLIVAPFFYVFGVFSAGAAVGLILFQSLLCGLTTWAIFVLAEKLYGPWEARIATLLFVFYPASIFFAVNRIGPSSLSALLLCLTFLALLAVPNSRRLTSAMWSGLLIGLVVLSSSDNLSLFLVVPLWLILMGGGGRRSRRLLNSTLVVGIGLLVLLPWSIRNSNATGEPTISKANLGYHLWVGNNPNATGFINTSTPPDVISNPKQQKKQSEYYSMAVSWILHNPQEFLILTLKRIQSFWYVIAGRGHSRNELLQGWLLLTMVALAAIGLFRPGRRLEDVTLLWLFVAIYPLVFYVTHASYYRHRYHIEPFVLILASHGLSVLWALLGLKRPAVPAPTPVDVGLSHNR
jgi:Dolichyl-phosphate-mannose-protein mannosyltransferase